MRVRVTYPKVKSVERGWYLIQVLGPFHCVTSVFRGWQETVKQE